MAGMNLKSWDLADLTEERIKTTKRRLQKFSRSVKNHGPNFVPPDFRKINVLFPFPLSISFLEVFFVVLKDRSDLGPKVLQTDPTCGVK